MIKRRICSKAPGLHHNPKHLTVRLEGEGGLVSLTTMPSAQDDKSKKAAKRWREHIGTSPHAICATRNAYGYVRAIHGSFILILVDVQCRSVKVHALATIIAELCLKTYRGTSRRYQ